VDASFQRTRALRLGTMAGFLSNPRNVYTRRRIGFNIFINNRGFSAQRTPRWCQHLVESKKAGLWSFRAQVTREVGWFLSESAVASPFQVRGSDTIPTTRYNGRGPESALDIRLDSCTQCSLTGSDLVRGTGVAILLGDSGKSRGTQFRCSRPGTMIH